MNTIRKSWWPYYFAMILSVGFVLFDSIWGLKQTWLLFQIPVMDPKFADLINVTHASLALDAGIDPLYHNPFDPWARPMPYPRIWHYARFLGFTPENTNLIAYLQVMFFMISVAFVFSVVEKRYLGVCLLALISPSVLFCIERGNVDLIIFVFTSLYLYLLYKQNKIALFVFLFNSIFKLYPFFTLFTILNYKSKKIVYILVTLASIFFLYLFFSFKDLKQTILIVNINSDVGFGWRSFLILLKFLNQKWNILAGFLITISLLYSVFLFRRKVQLFNNDLTIIELSTFLVGSATYCGMYFTSSNHNYKLIFLLFCFPFLFVLRKRTAFARSFVTLTIMFIVLILWYPISYKILMFIKPSGQYYTLIRIIEHVLHFNLFLQFLVVNLKFIKLKILDRNIACLKL
jgi:hypothetical protein